MAKKTQKSHALSPANDITRAIIKKNRTRRRLLSSAAEIEGCSAPVRNDLVPELRFERKAISNLKLPARLVRAHGRAQILQLKRSIRRLGVCGVVLVDKDNFIVDGVALVEAAREEGVEELLCVVIEHLSKAELRLLRLALNRLGEKGGWNVEQLQFEFQELVLEFGARVDFPGFERAEIDDILRNDDVIGTPDLELIPPLRQEAVTRLGDLWRLGRHHLYCGDGRPPDAIHIVLNGVKARIVLTDPPYNVPVKNHITKREHREFLMGSGEMSEDDLLQFFIESLAACCVGLVNGGLCLSFIDWRGYPSMLRAAATVKLLQVNLVVWSKGNAGMGSLYRSQHELLPIFKKGTAAHVNNINLGAHGRWRSNVWHYPGASSIHSEAREQSADHPTPKPVALLEDAIYDLTNPGDVVLDPFVGSGSTLVAAERTGRVCCAVELDPLYCDVTLRRWAKMTGEKPVLVKTGEPFPNSESMDSVSPRLLLPKPSYRVKAGSGPISGGGALA